LDPGSRSRADQDYTALQLRKLPSQLLIFPDEGHWILKPENSGLWYKTVLDWIDNWTKK
jgi:dipeptidyl aminopeptidase/acylaminoacyl peptidase